MSILCKSNGAKDWKNVFSILIAPKFKATARNNFFTSKRIPSAKNSGNVLREEMDAHGTHTNMKVKMKNKCTKR